MQTPSGAERKCPAHWFWRDGCRRFDLAVFPLHKQSIGVLLKFKAADSEKNALAQIEQMDYPAEFRAQKVETVWKYGIVFWGKRACIVARTSEEAIAFLSIAQ